MENMKIDILEKKGCLVEFKIEIPPEEVKKQMESVFIDIQKNAAIAGFRKGHAPMEFVKREFSKTAIEKTKHNIISSTAEKVIKEKNLQPIVTPVIAPLDISTNNQFDFAQDKSFSFKLKIEQAPEFKPKNYKKIKVIKKVKKITEKEVEDMIKNLQDRHARLEDAGDVAAEQHHFLVADYEGIVDGKKIGKHVENQIIDLSHKSLPDGFGSGLVGIKPGESKTIETKISDKPAKFNVKVKSIKKKILPEVDDEFAKDLGHENIAQLKEKIKAELINAENEKTGQDMEKQVIESLVKSNNFPVPETLVEEELNRSIERTKQYLVSNQSYNEAEFKKSIPAMQDKYKAEAEKTVRISYILSVIAKDENITVNPEDVDKKIEELSGGNKKLEENYNKHREHLSLQVKEKKLFDFLLLNAKIKEVKA